MQQSCADGRECAMQMRNVEIERARLGVVAPGCVLQGHDVHVARLPLLGHARRQRLCPEKGFQLGSLHCRWPLAGGPAVRLADIISCKSGVMACRLISLLWKVSLLAVQQAGLRRRECHARLRAQPPAA